MARDLMGVNGPARHLTLKQSTFWLEQLRNKVLFDGGGTKFGDDGGNSDSSFRNSSLETERLDTTEYFTTYDSWTSSSAKAVGSISTETSPLEGSSDL